MPTNLYGPGDNFNLLASHVIPVLMVKAHRAKLAGAPAMEGWGSGWPRREFPHADDLADACVHVMLSYPAADHLHVGTGTDIAIADRARLICDVVGFKGELRLDACKLDGPPRKLLDVSRLAAVGWKASIFARSRSARSL